MASPILNVTEFWIASTGEILDQSGTSQFHAQNNYANLILVNLEDGGGYDSTTFINFTPQTKTAYTSHWFYMSYQGLVEHKVGGEVRNFAQYAIRVPRVVLQNSNKNGFTINDVIVKQTYGDNFIGQFDTLASLNSEYPPTEALDDANSVAYVIADADKGFYQVELDGTYGWALMESVALTLETKQYNGVQIQVQAGSANPADVVSVSEETVKILMGILNNLQVDVDRIDANIDEIEDDAILLEARVLTNEEDIDLLEGRVTVNEEDIDLLEGRATNLETFQNTTVPATYETKANADTHRGRTTALENANMVKSIARTGTNLITITFYDNTQSTVITLAQLKTFIGEATNALSGLMTAQHVTDLDTIMALFDEDGDAVVNTIAEVLAIFENYPEGVDLVTALAGKVDKTTTIAGVDLQNDITKEELQIALDVDDIIDGTQDITFNNTISGLTATTIKGAIDELNNEKVDKVTGKELSTNDYTTIEKNKVANLPDDTNEKLAEKANKVQEDWITPTLLNGWTGDVKYRKDNFGIVHFKGKLIPGTEEALAFRLPSQYVPSQTLTFLAPNDSNGQMRFGRCVVEMPTRNVWFREIINVGWLDISVITYFAEV